MTLLVHGWKVVPVHVLNGFQDDAKCIEKAFRLNLGETQTEHTFNQVLAPVQSPNIEGGLLTKGVMFKGGVLDFSE